MRGAGTNGHANQGNGGSIGEHQDGSLHAEVQLDGADPIVQLRSPNAILPGKTYSQSWQSRLNSFDKVVNTKLGRYSNTSVAVLPKDGSNNTSALFTSRPTNTSFLICVKATVSGDANGHEYSTDEQIVGTTEDGETIYEKTYDNLSVSVPSSGWQEQALSISNMESLVDCKLFHNADGGTYTSIYYPTEVSIATGNYLGIRSNGLARTIVKIVLQYTKTQ